MASEKESRDDAFSDNCLSDSCSSDSYADSDYIPGSNILNEPSDSCSSDYSDDVPMVAHVPVLQESTSQQEEMSSTVDSVNVFVTVMLVIFRPKSALYPLKRQITRMVVFGTRNIVACFAQRCIPNFLATWSRFTQPKLKLLLL